MSPTLLKDLIVSCPSCFSRSGLSRDVSWSFEGECGTNAESRRALPTGSGPTAKCVLWQASTMTTLCVSWASALEALGERPESFERAILADLEQRVTHPVTVDLMREPAGRVFHSARLD